jgi:hypothetical protein
MNKEFSRRLEWLNSSLVELARARDEFDASPDPLDTTDPLAKAFERAVAEYEAADEDMLEYMSSLTGREIRRTAREPMLRPEGGHPAANAGHPAPGSSRTANAGHPAAGPGRTANASRPAAGPGRTANASRPAAGPGRKTSRSRSPGH